MIVRSDFRFAVFLLVANLLLAQHCPGDEEAPSLLIDVSGTSVVTGEAFSLGLRLVHDIEVASDLYLFADTPYGVFTIFLDGEYQKGINALHKGVTGVTVPRSATVWRAVRVPQGISGIFTFYAVLTDSGKIPPVSSPSDLSSDTEHVISLDKRMVMVQALSPPVNSAGRSGSYYLPPDYRERVLPLLLAYHGTGGSGEDMVSGFESLAEEIGFIIVAPDSRISPDGQYTWEIGEAGEVTEDFEFALEWITYVSSLPGVQVDDAHVMAVGFSGGGSSAPYIATNDPQFTAFASLHGGAYAYTIGDNNVPGWLSTGEEDTLRPPLLVKSYATALQNMGLSITYGTYPGGHTLSESEKSDLVSWWLGN